MRGRRVLDGGRRPGAGVGTNPNALVPAFSTLFRSADSDLRFDGTSFTQSGGNLTALVDRVSGTKVLNVVAGTITAPAASANFNNAPTIALAGTQALVSGDTAGFWAFLSAAGATSEWFMLFRPTSASLNVCLSTGAASPASPGIQVYINGSGGMQVDGANGSGASIAASPASPSGLNGRATYADFTFSDLGSPRYVYRDRSTQMVSSSVGGAGHVGDPAAPLRVGGQVLTGLFPGQFELAALWFFHRRLTAREFTACQAEALTTFGVALT